MGNITQLSQGNLEGLKKQVCECIDHAHEQGYKQGFINCKKSYPFTEEEVNKVANDEYNKGYADGKKEVIENSQDRREGFDNGYNKGYDRGYGVGFNEGLENAWKYINKLYQYGLNELQNYFDETSIPNIICRTSITDIIASINLYEEKKQVEEEIKIGDEVQFGKYVKGVIISIKDNWYRVVVDSGFVSSWKKGEFEKTGRNFGTEVSQLLDKLKGDN